MGLDVEVLCGPSSESDIYLKDLGTVPGGYELSGTTFLNGSGVLVYQSKRGGIAVNAPIPGAASGFLFTQIAAKNQFSEVVIESGTFVGNLLGRRDGHTATIAMSAVQSTALCSVSAQVTPAAD